MKERKLDFQKYDNTALVEDADGILSSKLQEGCKKINRNLGMLHELLAKGNLAEGMKKALLTSAEHEFTALLSDLGYAGILAEEKEKRYAQIRSLNIENRELRAQLGEKVSLEDIREKLKNIKKPLTHGGRSMVLGIVMRYNLVDISLKSHCQGWCLEAEG